MRKYTWRCEVEHNTLNLKREIIKTRPFMLIETFLFEHRIEHRVISYEGDQVIEYERTGPMSTLPSPLHLLLSLMGCYWGGGAGVDMIWDVTEFTFVGREMLDGRATMVYSFRTVPEVPEQHRADRRRKRNLKFVIGIEGTLWMDELDRVAVKSEARNYKGVMLGGGFSFKKGSYWEWQLKKSGDTWLPLFVMSAGPSVDKFRRRIVQTVLRFSDFTRVP